VLHRDIKPANLLLDLKGTVWVTDFGLAKAKETDDLTQEGEIIGTLRYMAPERFDGAGDHRADIYALGLTLYEMLTLRPAFNTENRPRLIEQLVEANPPRPRSINPAIPRDLETVALKAIAGDPAQRYQNAEALADDLRRFVEDRPVRARRATRTEQLWRWCRRNPAVASLVAAVLLVTTVGAVTASVFALRAEANARQADANARQIAKERDKARDAELEGRRKLFEAYVSDAKANRMSRRSGQRFQTLARVAEAAALGRELQVPQERVDELRQIAVTALAMPDVMPRYLGEVPPGADVPDISDDTSRAIFWEGGTKQHVIRSVGDGSELCRLPPTEHATQAQFSPDGLSILRYPAALPDGLVEVWNIGSSIPRLIRQDRLSVFLHHFRTDGRVLALALTDGTVLVWDLRTGAEIKRLPGVQQRLKVFLHPTEPLIASCSYLSARVLLRDYHTGQVVQTIDPPWPLGSTWLAWHSDKRRLFVAAGDTNEVQEYRFDPATRLLSRARLLHTTGYGGNQISINPAGDRLASCGWGGAPEILDLDTGRVLFQGPQLKLLPNFRFSTDRRSLIGMYGSPRGRSYGVVDVGDAREVRTIKLNTSGGSRPVIHPCGRLAVIPQGERFTFVDLAGLREMAVVKRGSHRWVSLAFDGQGRLYSNSFEGCFRWRVRFDGDRVTVGFPERLPFHPGSEGIAASEDGRTFAQAQYAGYGMAPYAGGWFLTPDRPDDPRYLKAGTGMDGAAVSPDGRWVCFCLHDGHALVYDSRTDRLAWEDMKARLGWGARFTADGRWLVGNWGACRVGDWDDQIVIDPAHTGGLHDVSPDSHTALFSTTEGYARLVEIATGRELVRIESPEGGLGQTAFNRDGTRLLEASGEGPRVWDLRRIRARLAELGIDWDAPPFPPEPEDKPGVPPPLQLTILGGELLSDPAKLAEHDRGVTTARLFINPFDAQGHLEVAMRLMDANEHAKALGHLRLAAITRPESSRIRMSTGLCLLRLRRAEEAIPEFTAAAKAQPEDYRAWHQRAQAYSRLGRHAEAAKDLTAVLARFPEDAQLYEERATCYAALGDKDREAADRAAAAKFLPRSTVGLNNRAWDLLTGPPGKRDPAKALELIQKAVKVEPDKVENLNTLGVALYRNGRFTEAVITLAESLAAGKGQSDGFDLFFLAMSHAKLGDVAKAKNAFDEAVAWVRKQKNLRARDAADLAQFREEAEKALKEP
jgi:tetratricopeptide (TPR) repeat protein